MKYIVSFTLILSLFVELVAPASAQGIVGPFPVTPTGFLAQPQPVINEVAPAVTADNQLIVTGQTAANVVYLPLISGPCWTVTPLQPIAAGATQQCSPVAPYAGAQGPGSLLVTVNQGLPSLSVATPPRVVANVPVGGARIGPQAATGATSLIAKFASASYMAPDAAIAAAPRQPPIFAGRIAWVILRALQDKATSNPTLFPVSIATPHYSEPSSASSVTTLFERCLSVLGGQLFVNGYPYDLIVDNDTTLGGSVWLQMKYPSCPQMAQAGGYGYYIRLSNFWSTLKTLPKYDGIEAEAKKLVGPTTYHVTDLPMRLPNGTVQPVGATIVVVTVGTLIFIAIFPEALLPAGAWWLLTGSMALRR